jgi:hypothetical protein
MLIPAGRGQMVLRREEMRKMNLLGFQAKKLGLLL